MSDSIPADVLPALASASAELLHAGLLVQLSDTFALERAESGRARFASEHALDAETDQALERARSAVQTTREIVRLYPEAVNKNIQSSLESAENRVELDRRIRAESSSDGDDYSSVLVSLCERIESSIGRNDGSTGGSGAVPPVTGGSDSLGCELILVGAMAGGATCVIGCGPCCVAGAAAALIYVGIC